MRNRVDVDSVEMLGAPVDLLFDKKLLVQVVVVQRYEAWMLRMI